jgi:YggT family protein
LTLVSQAVAFVLETIFDLFILAVLVRFWMQAFRAPVRNPLAQFTIALTDFAVKPLRRVVPGAFKLDLSSLLVAWLAEFVLQVLLLFVFGFAVADNPGVLSAVLFVSLVKLVRLSIYVFMGAVILQAVLSWFGSYHPVAPFFEALSRPFLRPIQRALPTIGGVDVSPVVVLIAFQLILMLPVAWLEGQTARLVARAFL